MGLTPISDKRLQIWVLNEINKSANHRNTHMLTMINNINKMSKQTMLTGQLMHRILTDNSCNASSGIVYTNQHKLDGYMANMLYRQLANIFENEKDNKNQINKLVDNINDGESTEINIPLTAALPSICLTADKHNYTITSQSSNMAVAIINSDGPNGKFGDIPALDWILQSSYLSTIYPTVSTNQPTLGSIPQIQSIYVDIPTALLEYNGDVLKRMPIYKRMAWLTSDINEINTLYPGESRSISPRFKTISFTAVDQHKTNDGIIESYDVSFGEYGGQYRKHAFHPGRLDENIARDNKWHDINEYQGAAQTISTLKRRCTQMLDHDPQLKVELAYTKERMDNGYTY